MPDMLVNLLKLSSLEPLLDELKLKGINIRRAQSFEISPVREFILKNFEPGWADEILVGFSQKPVTIFIATKEGRVIGFAAYECTRRNFFGPTGVSGEMRGLGIGKALLLASLWSLREMGYVYAIIGGVGPTEFYERAVGATVIPESHPGIYTDILRRK